MFDEIRTGLQARLPDIHASAPHGESASVFTISDDVPVDARVDLRNVSRVDIDDAFFECDFDMTFSWLTKESPHQIVARLMNAADAPVAIKTPTPSRNTAFNVVNVIDDQDEAAADANNGAAAASSDEVQGAEAGRPVWHPRWEFSNRVNLEVGSVVEHIALSERQIMARGMRLKQSVVDSYWATENLSREELEDCARREEKRNNTAVASPAAAAYKLPRKPTTLKMASEARSLADVMELLTKRCSSRVGDALEGSIDNGNYDFEGSEVAFKAPSKFKGATANITDEGVEGVTELVYKVKCRGLRFSVSFDNMGAFPYDALSLLVLVNFHEPFGIYQAHIARTLRPGNEFDSSSSFLGCSDEEENTDLEESCQRLPKDAASMYAGPIEADDNTKAKTAFRAKAKVQPDLHERRNRDLFAESAEAVLESAALAMRGIKESSKVAMPDFRPALDLVPIPGRMRLRVSNDYGNHDGLAEHCLRSQKWGIEDLYIQKLNRLPQVSPTRNSQCSYQQKCINVA
jgi:hypothetical protein